MCAVEWKKLGDLGTFENIGVDKKIVQGEPLVTLLNYVDVYKNKYITADIPTMKVTAPLKKVTACNVLKGDIFITPTSETKDDIGHTAVALDTLDNVVYSYHLMRYRLPQFNMINSYYINYVFDTFTVKEQIYKFANGLTRFGLSKDKFADIIIPYPSLAKQQEIVSHLDTFTTLISNLESELDMRRKQYEHYRNQLLDFEGVEGVEWKTLGEVCIKTENIKWKNATNDYYYIDLSSVERESNRITEVQSICKDNAPSRAQQIVLRNDILFGTTRPTLKRLCIVPQEYDNQICSTGFCVLRANINVISHRLLYYLLTTMSFYTYVENNQEGAGYPSISNSKIMKYEVPIPSLNTQREIVEKLDAFENLIQSLEQEIKLRKQQYEYYREKLLTFE